MCLCDGQVVTAEYAAPTRAAFRDCSAQPRPALAAALRRQTKGVRRRNPVSLYNRSRMWNGVTVSTLVACHVSVIQGDVPNAVNIRPIADNKTSIEG